MAFLKTIIFMGFLLLSAPSLAQQSLTIRDDGSNAGYATLSWDNPEKKILELKLFNGDQWQAVYRGTDSATTVSGLTNGQYRYGLFTDMAATPLAETTLTIQHHPLNRAWIFFFIGLLMFAALVTFISKEAETE